MMIKKILTSSAILATGLLGAVSTSQAVNEVNSLSLINAVTDESVGSNVTNFNDYDLTIIGDQINFRFNPQTTFIPETEIQSVRFIVTDSNGSVISDRVENQAPFAAFGDNNGDYHAYTPLGDSLFIEVRGYSQKFAQGTQESNSFYTAHFVRSVANTGLSIINPESNGVVASVSNGQTFSFADIGSNLNLAANFGNFTDQVGSVVFDQINGDADARQVENVSPFALYGDRNGNYNGQTFSVGTFSVRVRAFTGKNGSGEQLTSMTYVFNLTD